MSIIRQSSYLQCDNCETICDDGFTAAELRRNARRWGWMIRKGEDLCSDCAEERKKK